MCPALRNAKKSPKKKAPSKTTTSNNYPNYPKKKNACKQTKLNILTQSLQINNHTPK